MSDHLVGRRAELGQRPVERGAQGGRCRERVDAPFGQLGQVVDRVLGGRAQQVGRRFSGWCGVDFGFHRQPPVYASLTQTDTYRG
jgi:hypothetical protein